MFVDSANKDFDLIISAAAEWSGVMLAFYFTQGLLNAVTGCVRGMGYSMTPLILNLIGVCGTRILWVFVIFPLEPFHTFSGLSLLYPVSWAVTAIMMSLLCVVAFVRLSKEKTPEQAEPASDKEKVTV